MQLFKFYRWLVIGLLVAIFLVQFFLLVARDHYIPKTSVLLVGVLLLVFIIRQKISWLVGLFIFVIGIYDSIFIAIKSAEPTVFQFTSFIGNPLSSETLGRILSAIPDFFYLISLVVFLLKPVRDYFGISKSKVNSVRTWYLLEHNSYEIDCSCHQWSAGRY